MSTLAAIQIAIAVGWVLLLVRAALLIRGVRRTHSVHQTWRSDPTGAMTGSHVIARKADGIVSFRVSGRLRRSDELPGPPLMLLAFDRNTFCVADAEPQDPARSRVIWRQREQPMFGVHRYPAGAVLAADVSGMRLDLEGLGAAPVAALVGLPAALAAVVGARPERRTRSAP